MARKEKQKSASKASNNTTGVKTLTPIVTSGHDAVWSLNSQRAVYLVLLAAIYAPLSQLILAPVYGSVPSAQYHKAALVAAPLLAFSLRTVLPSSIAKFIPLFAFWIPTIQFGLFKYSALLGAAGPVVTELATTYSLIILSFCMAIKLSENVEIPGLTFERLHGTAPSVVLYVIFSFVQRLMQTTLPVWMGWNWVFSRIGLQMSIATLYGLILPQSQFWPAVPSIIFTMTANPHTSVQRTTSVLNNTLGLYNYTLLERRESLTGYLSVLEDHNNKFRVLRCDHSLLGGEWKIDTTGLGITQQVGEPIYAVFTMLEAVRLIQTPSSSIPDTSKTALNIGLGIGTAPSAMIAHGISTTVLELDPIVHYFAGKYFNLPKNHSYVIGDAVDFVHSRSNQVVKVEAEAETRAKVKTDSHSPSSSEGAVESLQYDYIIHDSFTGGAMPLSLFTKSFLTDLSHLLKPTGVIAINFAGDLDLPSAVIIYRTITSVFPYCRIFREDEEKSILEKILPNRSKSKSEDQSERVSAGRDKHGDENVYTGDFTNLVYFCLSPNASVGSTSSQEQNQEQTIKFRPPTKADYLESASRKFYMLPKHEFDAESKWGPGGTSAMSSSPLAMVEYLGWLNKDRKPKILDGTTGKVAREIQKYQDVSALGHWRLMRTVIPDAIWENW